MTAEEIADKVNEFIERGRLIEGLEDPEIYYAVSDALHQEIPLPPTVDKWEENKSVCQMCGTALRRRDRYCSFCGRKINWG